MYILADENIPLVTTAFAEFGIVETFSGRQLAADQVKPADVLLVRSVTPVSESLLAGSRVQFVGTATIGYDHIDHLYLQKQKIAFASAPGSNATSAAEYVISALLILAQRFHFNLSKKIVGIIGCGNVGSRVLEKLQALGVTCIVNDPPLQITATKSYPFADLTTLLHYADIVTLHVPLTTLGQYPTYQLVNRSFFQKLSPQAILINTSRGEVIDEIALMQTLMIRPEMQVVLDVWNGEPNINPLLLQRTALATPHIAGYSVDGKLRGTAMLYQALTNYLGEEKQWSFDAHLPPPAIPELHFSHQISDQQAYYLAVTNCYDVREDDARLRNNLLTSTSGIFFDQLRKQYPPRREFNSMQVVVPEHLSPLRNSLNNLGFRLNNPVRENNFG